MAKASIRKVKELPNPRLVEVRLTYTNRIEVSELIEGYEDGMSDQDILDQFVKEALAYPETGSIDGYWWECNMEDGADVTLEISDV